MVRNVLLAAFATAALLMLADQASAQITIPNLQRVSRDQFPKVDGLPPDRQKELQKAFEQAGQAAQPGRQPAGRANGAMEWGGLRMEKASVEMQTDLGLGEKEGLVVVAVAPNSVGDKAGLKAKDVLIRFGDKSVPNDSTSFGLLVKDHKEDEPIDLVVVRNGKEETLKGAKMPTLVENLGGNSGGRGIGIRPAIGFGAFRGPINPRLPNNPFQPGTIQNLHLEMNVNGAKIVRKQTNDQFSGEYSKDDLKITVNGKVENGQAKLAEITVTEGKETKKYTSLRDVPAQHRPMIQQLMPSAVINSMLMPMNPNLLELPGLLPVVPGLQR